MIVTVYIKKYDHDDSAKGVAEIWVRRGAAMEAKNKNC